MIYIVLGMHKSGTTLVARALHESGINMGEFPEGADYENTKYEAKWAQKINDKILRVERSALSLDVRASSIRPGFVLSNEQVRAISEGISKLSGKFDQWGFKDPRTALTFQLWKPYLPAYKVIFIYRNPIEVWQRYSRVNRKTLSRKAFTVWAEYNRKIIANIGDIPNENVLYLRFESLLDGDDEWNRLKEFSKLELTDVRNPAQSAFSIPQDDRAAFKFKLLKKFAGGGVMNTYDELEALYNKQLSLC